MSSNRKSDRDLERAYRELEQLQKEDNKNKNDLMSFFLGVLMLGAGLFWVLQTARVTTSFGSYFYHIGSFGIPNGLVVVPLLIGIMMLFMLDKKIWGGIVCSLGIIFILFTIIMSVRIVWTTTSAYSFILMFGLIAAGGGLVIKALFRK